MTENSAVSESGIDRSLKRAITVNWETVAWIVIIALAIVTRLYGLGDRAMSHDESLHTFYSWKLYDGQGYEHDPMMHGPLLFHATALSYWLFGVSDFTARLLAVVAGTLLVASPMLLRKWLSPAGALAAGTMLLISPTVMYYSRYIRHDIPVELFTVLMFISFIRYLDSRQGKWIVLAFAAGAGTVTSAEMGYINGFVLLSFIGIALLVERLGSKRSYWLEFAFLVTGLGLLLFASVAVTGRLGAVGEEEPTRQLAMQLSFLLSGLFLIFGLVSPLISRYLSVPRPGEGGSDWQLIDVLPQSAAGGGSERAARALQLLIGGVVVLLVGALLIVLPSMLSDGSSGAAVESSARTLGLLLLAGGWFVALYALAMRMAALRETGANLVAFVVGLVPAVIWGGVWYLAAAPLASASTAEGAAPAAPLALPGEFHTPVLALALASLAVVVLAVLGWLLEVYEERGTAAAVAGASMDSIGVAAVVFAVIYALLFTTFFTNPDGIDGFVRSIKYWLDQHDVVRGGQPWYYYGIFTPMYEFLPFLLSLAAIVVYAAKRGLRFGLGNDTGDPDRPVPAAWAFVPMIIVWGAGNFWIFSWAGEKMPWLIVHLVVPMTFLGGRLVGDMCERVDWQEARSRGWMLAGLTVLTLLTVGVWLTLRPFQGQSQEALSQTAGWVLALPIVGLLLWAVVQVVRRMSRRQAFLIVGLTVAGLLLLVNTRYSLMANFVNDELATEYIVYAHGTPDDKEVYEMLEEMQERLGVDEPLLIGYDNEVSWPFTWYFRDDEWESAQYLGERPSGTVNHDVLLVGSPNYGAFEPYLRDRYASIEFRRMWWPNEGYKGLTLAEVWKNIADPNLRRNWIDILLYREYKADPSAEASEPKSLTDWYHQANMRLYVRKDLIDQLWPLVQARPDWLAQVETGTDAVPQSAELEIEATFFDGPDGEPLLEPKGIELGPDGRLYVVDHGQWRVVAFDNESGQAEDAIADGALFYYDGSRNESPSAWGVGIAEDGAVYVADTWNHRVLKYENGRETASVGSYGTPEGGAIDTALDLFFGPRDVAIGPDGNVYVTDTGNKRVVVLDPDLAPIRAFGGDGYVLGQFNEPTSLAFDPETGELYVADLWNFRIQRFDADFTPVADWTVDGWDSQEAAHKAYIAVGPNGTVVASDPSGMRVWVFDRDGNVLATLDLPNDERGLDLPIGVAIDASGRIFVAGSNSGVVTRYAPLEAVVEYAGLGSADAEEDSGETGDEDAAEEGALEDEDGASEGDADADADLEGAEGAAGAGEGEAEGDADTDAEGDEADPSPTGGLEDAGEEGDGDGGRAGADTGATP